MTVSGLLTMRPFAKQRPRSTARGITYMARDYVAAKECCVWQLATLPMTPFTGPVKLTLVLTYTGRSPGDVDNLAGGFMDAANGLLWKDDRQIAWLDARRVKGGKGQAETIQFTVEELG